MTPTEIAYSFVEAINSGDPDRLSKLMTENHTFIDADGSEHSGREEMHRGWGKYFTMVPDFQIHVEDALSRDDTVALFGVAEGTFDQDGALKPENHWVVPAAWRVVVEDGRVAVWQLYVNPERMVEILNRIESA
jgi:ketosteroid isomerase-like protein